MRPTPEYTTTVPPDGYEFVDEDDVDVETLELTNGLSQAKNVFNPGFRMEFSATISISLDTRQKVNLFDAFINDELAG